MRTYYLFIDHNHTSIEVIIQSLQSFSEPGILFETIKNNIILPKCIVIKSLYKDEYLKIKIKHLLAKSSYQNDFQILKPLTKESTLF